MEQTFGSFVREKRQSIGLSLRTLAAKLDLSPVYLSNIENDRRPAPTRAYLERLEQELHALTDFFDEVRERCQFKYWFFGHYHENMVVEKKFAMLYEQIICLK